MFQFLAKTSSQMHPLSEKTRPETLGYTKLQHGHDHDQHSMEARPLGSSDCGSDERLIWGKPRQPSTRHLWLPFTLLLLVSNMLSAIMGVMLGETNMNLDRPCAAHTTQYSPVLKDIDIGYAPHEFNGSFLQQNIYRLPGSPAVDAAWQELGVDYRASVISYEEGLKSGLTQAHVRRADKYGGGFFVNVEGMHHLHCLNLVRKATYYNYEYYKDLGTHAFKNDEKILQLHVSHCIDTIRQVLMCNVDTGVLGQVWYDKESPRAFPDFNTKHTCKNYDAVRAWAQDHQEPLFELLPDDYMRTADDRDVLPYTP